MLLDFERSKKVSGLHHKEQTTGNQMFCYANIKFKVSFGLMRKSISSDNV